MKKTWMILIFVGFTSLAMAQTEKGNVMVGIGTTLGLGEGDGLMGLAFTSSELELADGSTVEDKLTSFFLSTKGGFFLVDRFAAGLELAVSTSSGTTEFSGIKIKSNFSFLGAGPFARYYFSSGKILPFAEVNSLFGSRKQDTSGSGGQLDTKFSVANLGGGVGLAILLGEKSSLDLMASYNSTSLKETVSELTTKQNSLGLKLGFTMFF